MAPGGCITDSDHMRTITEELALRIIDSALSPLALITIGLVLVAVFSGAAGRVILYLETRLSSTDTTCFGTRRCVGIR